MCLCLSSCCCCISLEVGAQIISIVTTMISAIVMMLYGAAVIMLTLPKTRMLYYAAVSGIAACQLVLGCLLSYGAFMKKPGYMWPWVVLSWLVSVALVALSVVGIALLVYWGHIQESNEVNCMITIYIVYALILFYFTSVVNSRRAEMMRESSYTYNGVLLRPVNSWKYV